MDRQSRDILWSLFTGRRGAGHDDHGEPQRVSGGRSSRRAGRSQTIKVGPLGGVRVQRAGNRSGRVRDIPELRDRYRR